MKLGELVKGFIIGFAIGFLILGVLGGLLLPGVIAGLVIGAFVGFVYGVDNNNINNDMAVNSQHDASIEQIDSNESAAPSVSQTYNKSLGVVYTSSVNKPVATVASQQPVAQPVEHKKWSLFNWFGSMRGNQPRQLQSAEPIRNLKLSNNGI